jgi:hypothetical protein
MAIKSQINSWIKMPDGGLGILLEAAGLAARDVGTGGGRTQPFQVRGLGPMSEPQRHTVECDAIGAYGH